MKKIVASWLITAVSIFAVDVPLEKVNTVEIAIGEFAVFDFPFEIKGANPTSFRSEYTVEKLKDEAQKISGGTDYLDEKLPPKKKTLPVAATTQKGKKGQETQDQAKPVIIKRTSHTISILPKKYGDMSFLVWGHKDLPAINLKIKVVKSKSGATNVKFIDYQKEAKVVKKLEQSSHEKVVTVLVTHLYNNLTPKGYASKVKSKKYNIGKVKMKLVRSLVGEGYRADEWLIKNGYSEKKRFHEEMFYNDGIYAVALENNVLAPGEATRLFVVRNNSK